MKKQPQNVMLPIAQRRWLKRVAAERKQKISAVVESAIDDQMQREAASLRDIAAGGVPPFEVRP